MENKITLRFKLDNLQNIGFAGENIQQEFFEGLQMLHESGIEILSNHYDDLCKNTINNGHNLLKSNGIFNIDTSVVNPMSIVIGQFLFRLLFGNTKFQDNLHRAKKAKKELEIVLEFDLNNNVSKDLASLPWELMYCPESKKSEENEEAEDDEPDGFFVSQVASIYRMYHQLNDIDTETETDVKRKVNVSIAFLTKDIENLKEVHVKLKAIAAKVEAKNSNIHFEFINSPNRDKDDVYLLTKDDLVKIFLGEKDDKDVNISREINKIVHIICDVSNTQDDNNKTVKSLFFNKIGIETESISFPKIFIDLFHKGLLSDPFLKLVVLQAWKDENRFDYSGFEEMVHRIRKRTRTAVISMPYVLNQGKNEDGKDVFFDKLYLGLADSLSTIQIVQKLRNEIVQKYSYGFPILYLNGRNQVLVSNENIAQQQPTNTAQINPNSNIEKYKNEYKNLEPPALNETLVNLQTKLKYFTDDALNSSSTKARYETDTEIMILNDRITAVKLLLKG